MWEVLFWTLLRTVYLGVLSLLIISLLKNNHVRLTSCFKGLDLTKGVNTFVNILPGWWNFQHGRQFFWGFISLIFGNILNPTWQNFMLLDHFHICRWPDITNNLTTCSYWISWTQHHPNERHFNWEDLTREHSHWRGKYLCTAGIQFDWFGFSNFSTYNKQHIYLFVQIQSS